MNELDRLIRSFYARVTAEDWRNFRPGALEMLCKHFGASAAAWVTHGGGSVWGEFTVYPAGLAVTPQKLLSLPFKGGREIPLPPEMALTGAKTGVALSYAHEDAGSTSTIVLWSGPKEKLTGGEAMQRAVGHLAESSRMALQNYIQRDEWLAQLGRSNRGTAALVDASGTLYAATRGFRDLLGEAFNAKDAPALPFQMPESAFGEDGLFGEGNLRFRATRAGDLYLLHARKPQPLDGLSPREQQIARALGNGKTFKTVARQCGIAVSTVANHASRIYRKLGIYRREDLVELIRAPRESVARH